MEFPKDGDDEEEHFNNLCIEKELLLLLSDDNQNAPDARCHVSKDPLYLFKIVHGSCGCSSYSRVQKRTEHTKIQFEHQVKKVLKPKTANGTGVFIPQPGHVNRRKKLNK